jgi:phage terminase small subunit
VALTGKQKAFIDHYLANGFNATKAALAAGYSEKTAYSIGQQNLKKVEITEAIKQAFADRAMPGNEVLVRLAEHARGTMEDFLYIGMEEITLNRTITVQSKDDQELGPVLETVEEVETVQRPIARIDLQQAALRGKLHLVKKYSLTDKGVSVELYDAQTALGQIGRHHGLFVDKTALTDPTGTREYADSTLDAIKERLLAQLTAQSADPTAQDVSGEPHAPGNEGDPL